jgi:hypothetical protein
VKKLWKAVNIPDTKFANGDGEVSLLLRLKASRLAASPVFPSAACCAILFRIRKTPLLIKGAASMEWTTPKHEEIDLNCEVSSYANAEL